MIDNDIEAVGLPTLQALLFGFATAKTDGLTSQNLVAAIVGRPLTIPEASRVAELEREQYDTVEALIGLPPRHTVSLLKKLPPQAFENDSFPDREECKKHYSPEFLEWLARFTEANKLIVAIARAGSGGGTLKNV